MAMNRRDFLKGAGATTVAAILSSPADAQQVSAPITISNPAYGSFGVTNVERVFSLPQNPNNGVFTAYRMVGTAALNGTGKPLPFIVEVIRKTDFNQTSKIGGSIVIMKVNGYPIRLNEDGKLDAGSKLPAELTPAMAQNLAIDMLRYVARDQVRPPAEAEFGRVVFFDVENSNASIQGPHMEGFKLRQVAQIITKDSRGNLVALTLSRIKNTNIFNGDETLFSHVVDIRTGADVPFQFVVNEKDPKMATFKGGDPALLPGLNQLLTAINGPVMQQKQEKEPKKPGFLDRLLNPQQQPGGAH
jgi:hypothetical protein